MRAYIVDWEIEGERARAYWDKEIDIQLDDNDEFDQIYSEKPQRKSK